jgi:beta-glucanase (GH16 family)
MGSSTGTTASARSVRWLIILIGAVLVAGLLAAVVETTGSPAPAPRPSASPPTTARIPARTTTTLGARPTATTAPSTAPALSDVVAAADPTPSHATTTVHNVTTTSTTSARTASTSTTSTTAASNQSDCGGTAPLPGNWLCTFDDEFNGTSLDTTKWIVQQTATSGYTAGPDCYVDSANNVSVSGGTLNLTVRKEAAPFTCSDPFGNFTTSYTSGMVSTDYRFSQTYGLFEVRARLPATTIKGLQETFWLWPVDSTKYGSWPASGEIDFAEFYSQYSNLDIPYIHYNAAGTDPNVTAYNCTINVGQFNTYGLEWTPTTLTVLDNNQTCLVDTWNPALPLSKPEPFNQPFFIALTQALGVDTNAFEPGTTPLPATTQIDWVRAWSAAG